MCNIMGYSERTRKPKTYGVVLKPIVMAGFIHDMALMESMLMESKLCYTVVRPPELKNGK